MWIRKKISTMNSKKILHNQISYEKNRHGNRIFKYFFCKKSRKNAQRKKPHTQLIYNEKIKTKKIKQNHAHPTHKKKTIHQCFAVLCHARCHVTQGVTSRTLRPKLRSVMWVHILFCLRQGLALICAVFDDFHTCALNLPISQLVECVCAGGRTDRGGARRDAWEGGWGRFGEVRRDSDFQLKHDFYNSERRSCCVQLL